MKKQLLAPKWYKAASFWLAAFCAVLTMPGVYEQLVALFPEWERYAFLAIMVARMINQAPKV